MGWVIFPVMDELPDAGGGLLVWKERWIRKGGKEGAIVMSMSPIFSHNFFFPLTSLTQLMVAVSSRRLVPLFCADTSAAAVTFRGAVIVIFQKLSAL